DSHLLTSVIKEARPQVGAGLIKRAVITRAVKPMIPEFFQLVVLQSRNQLNAGQFSTSHLSK
ncbi:hypothetical protein, partial [Salmonella enterica]|uniref:hypothetical protein n=1 Tax=Salmonella enterica TaxID=28901 RepID=UPI0022B5FB75